MVRNRHLHLKGLTVAGLVSSDSKAPTIFTNTLDSAKGRIDIEVDSGNGGGDKFDDRSKKRMALSMSQKLTLGYAALVGGKHYCLVFFLSLG